MSNVKKLMMTAAGGDATNVEDVFNTTLYVGNGSSQTINNGIDLAGNGGLVWTKSRANSYNNNLYDTERGGDKPIFSDSNGQQSDYANDVISFQSTGYELTSNSNTGVNGSGENFVSWSFRKCPKFFDVVTYTGDGQNSRTVSHNLGSVPAVIWIKAVSSSGSWSAVHRTHTNTSTGNFEYVRGSSTGSPFGINSTTSYDTAGAETHITSTSFIPAQVGHPSITNSSGTEYVAYIFAHNDGDGEFGTDADQDIIKCGRFTTNSSGNADVSFGWEPQFLIIRRLSSGSWWMVDDMRGWLTYSANNTGTYSQYLTTDTTNAENNIANVEAKNGDGLAPRATYSNTELIYIAIRRDMKLPESATDVFAMDYGSSTNPDFTASFDRVDMATYRNIVSGGDHGFYDRVRGEKRIIYPHKTQAEGNFNVTMFDLQNEWFRGSTSTNFLSWMWKRAPSFFDIVTWYSGTSANRRIPHSLGVAPEMIWTKVRAPTGGQWFCYHKDMDSSPRNYKMYLNAADAKSQTNDIWGTSDPTSTDFGLNENDVTSGGSKDAVGYLWATLPGISKVGGYTGNGTNQTIDCGFSSGARYVLLKRTNASGDWYIFDSVRGINSGNDPLLLMNGNSAQNSNLDTIDPHSSGFIINQTGADLNVSNASYIFFAIA